MITVIIVLPLWWIFYELIYVEIAMFISVMKVDAYYVPRSCILVMTSMFMRECVGERVH